MVGRRSLKLRRQRFRGPTRERYTLGVGVEGCRCEYGRKELWIVYSETFFLGGQHHDHDRESKEDEIPQ